MAATDKDTIYIDIDDEITGIIDKFKSSNGKVVALVLPKRASVFQSIVNMKLLKRAANDSGKHLVLITSEAGLMPLAGAAGVHVAKTLTSKPEVPVAPQLAADREETVDEDAEPLEITAEDDGDRPVGELAAADAAANRPPTDNGVETVELDNDEPEAAAAATPAAAKAKKPKKDSKLKVPNFKRFRTLVIIGVLILILLIVGLVSAITVLPKATISIKTDAATVPIDFSLNLSTTASELQTRNNTVPAKLVQQQKTYTGQTSTTGQKNNGTRASGSVKVVNCSRDDDESLPAGTGFSANGSTYISQESVTIPASNYRKNSCQNDGSASVNVTAQSPGSSANAPSGTKLSIAGGQSDLSATSNNISGGTDNIVQTVSSGDINTAKGKINTNDDGIKSALQSQLKGDGYYAVTTTFTTGTPTTTNSANVGDAATSVTVTETVTYTMFGARQSDLKTLIDTAIKDKIDTSRQTVLDDGLDSANFNLSNANTTTAQLTLATSATAGPDLDTDSIKSQSAGKKSGEIQSTLKANPDVTDVDVKLSPFWVSSVPKKQSKIMVNIAKPTVRDSN